MSRTSRGPLDHEPSVLARGAGELPHEPRLADARLSHQRDDLPRARCRLLQRALELGHFGRATDEGRQAAGRHHLEPRMGRGRPSELDMPRRGWRVP